MDLLWEFTLETWGILAEMAPYLLFGFLVAGVLSVCISAEVIERHLGRRGLWPVVKASLFGIPLPLCSCGVIPVGASLRRHGASGGATTSFLISTPQTGVDSIAVTYSLLGPLFAIVRPIAALVSGLVGGTLVSVMDDRGRANGNDGAPPSGASCNEPCCSDHRPRSAFSRVFHYGFVTLPQDIARALLLGLVIAGLIGALVPDDLFGRYLDSGLGAMLIMLVVGIPLYVCATGSVPIAAALLLKGISPGAVLVFLMTGPATNAAAFSTIWKVLGRRTAITYVATVAVTALLAGLALDALVDTVGGGAGQAGHAMLPAWLEHGSAVVLLGVLVYALATGRHGHEGGEKTLDGNETIKLSVTGMSCNHCVSSVTRALSEVDGVSSVNVDLSSASAVVSGTQLDPEALCEKVSALGFEASPA